MMAELNLKIAQDKNTPPTPIRDPSKTNFKIGSFRICKKISDKAFD